MDHKQRTFVPEIYLNNFLISSNRTFWAPSRFEEHIKLHKVDLKQTKSAPKIPSSDKRTNISVTSCRDSDQKCQTPG